MLAIPEFRNSKTIRFNLKIGITLRRLLKWPTKYSSHVYDFEKQITTRHEKLAEE